MSCQLDVNACPPKMAATHPPRPAVTAAAILLYWLLVAGFQHWSRAGNEAFGGYPDESSHYLSSLMIRDYIRSGIPGTPLNFATNYYVHMPFLAIGYWPPLFYVLEGFWMTAFGYERFTALLFPALVAAFLCATCFWLLVPYLGRTGAFLSGVVLLFIPAVQWSNCLVMVDTTLALVCLWAGLAFARWAKTGSPRTALMAGLLTAAGLLIKINAIYLTSVFFVFFLITKRWALLRRPSFWIMPGVIAAVWAPWILNTWRLTQIGWGGLERQQLLAVAAGLGRLLIHEMSFLLPLALWGAVHILRRERDNYFLLICVLSPVCYALFLVAARIDVEGRFLLPIVSPSIVLAGIGLNELALRFERPELPARRLRPLLCAICVAGFVAIVGVHQHIPLGNQVRPVVEFLRSRGTPEQVSVLVPSDGEGPFIAEFAMRDKQRPARLLVRPVKLLATVAWNGGSYHARYQTQADVVGLFDTFPIRYTVVPVELGAHTFPHDHLLKETLEAHPERWTRVSAPPGPWLVYERADGRSLPPSQMEAIAREVLGPRIGYFSNLALIHK